MSLSMTARRPGESANATMPGAYVTATGELAIRELPIPATGGAVALIQTVVSTVCGSDLHRFRGADSYGYDTDVFGHETVGRVVGCESGEFLPGQLVLHVPFPADGKVFAPYQYAHVGQLVALPEGMRPDQAVFSQQLGTVVYALRHYIGQDVPQTAFISGAGPSGLLFLQLLRDRGCGEVYVAEPDPDRMTLAESFGALRGCPEGGVELAIDASGTLSGREACVEALARGGTFGVFGLPDDEPGDLGVSVLTILGKNLTVVGAMGAQGEGGLISFRQAVELIAQGRVSVDRMISHRGPLASLPELCRRATAVRGGVVKVLVDFDAPHHVDEEHHA